MKKKIGIYLAGSIKKGHENPQETFWTEQEMSVLHKSFRECDVVFLNPAFRKDNLADQLSVFGRDMTQVFCSHAVFVDARDRRGLGVGAEMMWAKLNRIPVITWAPRNSHYHKTKAIVLDVEVDNFIHPFVYGLSDQVIETLPEGAVWLERILSDPSAKIKGIEHVHQAMEYYQENQLPADLPMKEILEHAEFQTRLIRSAYVSQ